MTMRHEHHLNLLTLCPKLLKCDRFNGLYAAVIVAIGCKIET